MVVAVACSATPEAAPAEQAVATPTSAATPTVTPTASPTAETPEPTTLTIWFPDTLLPANADAVAAIVEADIAEFSNTQDGIVVDLRRKAESDVGGIMAILRSASSVAPGALPDITLLRRSDLVRAVEDGLIQPIEGRVASAVIADLFPAALRLGRADDQLYALPYLAELYLFAYDADNEPVDRMTFDAVFDLDRPLVVPAASSSGIADVLWLQYSAAGGILDSQGALTEAAVEAVFSFYDMLRTEDLIVPGSVDYSSPGEYSRAVATGQIPSGVVKTSQLAQFADTERATAFSSIPTSTGDPVSSIDAWMWVIVTQDPEQQAIAGRFINWMMNAERHGTFAQAVSIPPTQRNALRRWSFPGLENVLLSDLMTNAFAADQLVGTGGSARAMQAAWIDLITGELNAQEAVRSALQP
ncbi:MAG: extracellular solute-binding protein [Chloroflexi bacterium]|nr:extracellular solute-binding protein [Chloroflexota bacterium]